MSAKQTDRVLAALRAHPRGITAVDFLLPDVIDGGTPITRLGARILDLRDQGCRIETVGRRQKCVIYKLILHGDMETATGGAGTDLPGRANSQIQPDPADAVPLFDTPVRQPSFEELVGPQCAINDDLGTAA